MHTNIWINVLAGIIPLLTGFIWYHPKVFGNVWTKESGINPDKPGGNMAVIFGLTFVFGVFISLLITPMVIHQFGLFSMLLGVEGVNDPATEIGGMVKKIMDLYGSNFRTFKHGALHGTITGVLFVLPIMAINAMFDRKSWKYILINAGYWVLTLALIGGVVCQFA